MKSSHLRFIWLACQGSHHFLSPAQIQSGLLILLMLDSLYWCQPHPLLFARHIHAHIHRHACTHSHTDTHAQAHTIMNTHLHTYVHTQATVAAAASSAHQTNNVSSDSTSVDTPYNNNNATYNNGTSSNSQAGLPPHRCV